MAAVTDQDRFEAAVKIITGLPKDGPFQPSNDMKLKFYGLYKQATLGPCTASQPAFWDIINRAKWGAWKALGDISKEEAMRNYVEILKQVVETMTLDANVQDFLEKMGPIYEFVTDDGRVISKSADINMHRPDAKALAMLNMAKGNQLMNGNHSPEKSKQLNGDVVRNGSSGHGGPNHLSSEESEIEDNIENHRQERKFIGVGIRKSDLDAGSDEEEFDDASDNQAFASVTVDIVPVQSSGSHSPLSYGSTPRRSSKAVQPNDDSVKSLDGDKTAATLLNSSVDLDLLSPTRRRAATALGQLLRQLPESGEKTSSSDVVDAVASNATEDFVGNAASEDSIVRAWAVLRRIHAEQVQQAQDDDDWLARRLKRLKRGKSAHRKHRGRGGNNDGDGSNGDNSGGGSGSGNGGNVSGGPLQPNEANNAGAGMSSRRSQRQLSGESGSSSSSSGGHSTSLDFDPHVGAVLLRVHRELQHINRQLELVEGILISQQQMIRSVIADSNEAKQKKNRLGFFSNMPWRTILFILAWPVVVNVVVRICIFKMKRRR